MWYCCISAEVEPNVTVFQYGISKSAEIKSKADPIVNASHPSLPFSKDKVGFYDQVGYRMLTVCATCDFGVRNGNTLNRSHDSKF